MGTVTKPYTFADGDIIDALKFNNNFDALYGEFNGNIDNANVKALAGIVGSKIASAPDGIDTAQLNNNAVTDAKLRSDAVTDGNRAVTTNHIRDKAVTGAKVLSDNVNDANRAINTDHLKNLCVNKDKVRIDEFTWAPGGVLNPGTSNSISTGITTSTGIPLRLELRRNGVPDGTVAINCILLLWLNTATSTYHVSIGANGNLWDTTGITIAMVYIKV